MVLTIFFKKTFFFRVIFFCRNYKKKIWPFLSKIVLFYFDSVIGLKVSLDLISSPLRSHEHLNFSAKHCWVLSTKFLAIFSNLFFNLLEIFIFFIFQVRPWEPKTIGLKVQRPPWYLCLLC